MLDQAREYLARVVPWPQAGEQGFVNIHWTFPPKKPRADGKPAWTGRAVVTMTEAVSALNMALKAGGDALDIYVCMSKQSSASPKVSGKGFKYSTPVRLAANAVALKSFFLDVDYGKTKKDPATGQMIPVGYQTAQEAVQAVMDFAATVKLPRPTMVVHSGGGFHFYWCIDRALTPHEWLPIAFALAEATKRHGLHCDTQCTVDSARVLRIPDTFNRKLSNARPVRIIGTPVEYDYSVSRISVALEPYVVSVASATSGLIDRNVFPQRTAPAWASAQDTGAEALQSNIDELRPAVLLGDVLPVCGFLSEAVKTGGANFDNPLWNLTTLIAAFTDGGRADAHLMADKHGGYSKDETDALYDRKYREKTERGLGWPSCAAISGAGARACQTCSFRAHGKSPLNFEQRPVAGAAGQGNAASAGASHGSVAPAATPVATGFGGAVIAPVNLAPQQSVQSPSQLPASSQADLPPGFQRDAQGYINKIVADPNNPGQNLLWRICDYPMDGAWLQKNPMVLHFESVVERGQHTQVDLPFEVAATNEMRKVLQAQGFMIPSGDKMMGDFFVNWIGRLQTIKDMVNSSPFGWLHRNGTLAGFVYGDKLWSPAGSTPAAPADHVLAMRYRPRGSDTFWMDAAKLVCGHGRPDLEVLVASAFAAPLMQFTGHKGTLLSAFSRQSGLGKSTAITVAQAVWGDPTSGVQGLNDTENAVMGVVSKIKSLPLYWDELKSDAQTKKFVNMTFQISSGKGKSRMNSRAELKEPGDWQTLIISASNESLLHHVVSQTSTTEAGLMRVFEYKVAPRHGQTGRVATSDAQIRLSKLNNNFGHVGLRYAQFLGSHHGTIATDMEALAKQVEQETGADQEERFWVSVISCLLLGARYAVHIGYPVFDQAALKDFLYSVLDQMRVHRKEQTVDLDQTLNVSAILNRFFNDIKKNDSWLVTSRVHVGAGKPPKTGPNAIQMLFPADPSRLHGVDVQIGVGNNLLRISSSALGAWCKKNEVNKVNLLDALFKQVTVNPVKNGRMGAGTPAAGANEHIIEIDLTSSKDLDFVSDLV